MKIVIVGGVAGGATAAARIRRLDEKAEIVVFERSGLSLQALKKIRVTGAVSARELRFPIA